jgi:hypothetical protein
VVNFPRLADMTTSSRSDPQAGRIDVSTFSGEPQSVWAVLGAGVFFVLAVTVGLIVRARPMKIRSGRAE